MARKRPNPKKDKSARRRRSQVPGGLRRAHLNEQAVFKVMMGASPEALPLVALAGVWLWNVAEDGAAAAHCVDGCLTLQYALAQYGIDSRVEAVGLQLQGNGTHTRYGDVFAPRYNADGSFNGHTVLVVPPAGRFVDPTLQQYAEVPHTEKAMLPVLCPLPTPNGLGDEPIGVDRGDHLVIYLPAPLQQRQAWQLPAHTIRAEEYRQAAQNLAANVFAMMRLPMLREKVEGGPYPRLRTLLAALEGTEPVADPRGFRFKDPATGREIWLADVPDQ
jgi:hypothetical protein